MVPGTKQTLRSVVRTSFRWWGPDTCLPFPCFERLRLFEAAGVAWIPTDLCLAPGGVLGVGVVSVYG